MTIDSVTDLVSALRDNRLLGSTQVEAVAGGLQGKFTEPLPLAEELVSRGWLTHYQLNHIFRGAVQELVIGPYIVLDLLGEGGMGMVYKARHSKLDRITALKVLGKAHLTKPDAIGRFQREMQAVSQLLHPNIVMAYDSSQAGGTYYLAMEFVEGDDLGKLVKATGPLPIGLACEYVRQAAQGLQHAFERGLVHRDIKPSNLLVTDRIDPYATTPVNVASGEIPPSVVKILDMGLARAGLVSEDLSSTLTQEGSVLGTPDFISPEQARNAHTVDIRSDIYSLGCTLYFLLTAKVPFPGGALTEKLLQHLMDAPKPIRELRPEVPEELAAVAGQMMAKKPDDRHQTPADVVWALAPFSQPGPIPTRTSASDGRDLPSGLAHTTFDPNIKVELPPAGPTKPSAEHASHLPRPETSVQPAPDTFTLKRLRQTIAAASSENILIDTDNERSKLLEYRQRYPGSSQWCKAAEQLACLPSPLDKLQHNGISTEEQFTWQPRELVAVLGQHRWRHWGVVRSVAFSPDGRFFASCGDDKVAVVWSVATGRERFSLRGHARPVVAVAFSPDGKTLATASQDKTVQVWDALTGTSRAILKGHAKEVSCLAYSPDGKTLATGSADGSVRLWEIATGQERSVLPGGKVQVAAVAFSPDGRLLATGSADGATRLWTIATGAEAFELQGHSSWVTSVAFTPDGRHLATAGADGSARVWDLTARKEWAVLQGHGGALYNVTFAPDGKTLATTSADGTAKLWSMTTGRERLTFQGHAGEIHGLAFAPDGRSLATASADGTVRLWLTAAPKERTPLQGHVAALYGLAFAPDDLTLATASADGTARIWDVFTHQERHTLRGHTGWVTSVAFSPEGRSLLTGSADGVARLWNTGSGKETFTLRGHTGWVTSVAFSPDGRTVATGSADCSAKLWDPYSGQERAKLQRHTAWVTSVAFSPDSRLLASSSADATVNLWDVASAEILGTLPGRTGEIHCLAFAPDGRTLAIGSEGAVVQIWDVVVRHPDAKSKKQEKQDTSPSKEKITLSGHEDQVFSVAFSPDGKTLASAGGGGMIILWDVAAGKKLRDWHLPGAVSSLAFASDGRHLATANANGTVYILRVGTRPETKSPKSLAGIGR